MQCNNRLGRKNYVLLRLLTNPAVSKKMKALKLLYRFLRFRKGFGVHSPFAFDLITNVIEDDYVYPCYARIESVRRRLLRSKESFGENAMTVGKAAQKYATGKKRGQLLFRLANYLGPKRLLQVGSGMGISTLYLTAYASNLHCISLENDSAKAKWARWCLREGGKDVETLVGEYGSTLPEALERLGTADFLFFSAGLPRPYDLFEKCAGHIQPKSILVIEGLYDTPAGRECWQRIKSHPSVALTFDLYHVGLVFFDKRFYRKDYTVYF